MLKFRPKLHRYSVILLVLIALGVAAGLLIDRDANKFTVQTAIGETNETPQESEDFQYLERANRAFINLVARTRPAIVQIETIAKRPQQYRMDVEEFRRFFGDERFELFRDLIPDTPRRLTKGIGSGVIVSDDGYILTNNHVIEGAEKITATLANGRNYEAKLIGRDPGGTDVSGTDLAVLKIDAERLPVLPFGDSDALQVGEWVIAIGTPLNLSQTVTRGIVSAKNRPSQSIKYGNFIQIDAPINQGNSGGALINIRGELVGINTLIAIDGLRFGNIGIGFAIPSNIARDLLPQLIENGEIVRGWLGISMDAVNHDLAEKLKLDAPRGVFVTAVGQNSPAEKGGIRHGDVILEFNGKPIRDLYHLMYSVGTTPAGTSVQIKVLRNGKETQLTVKLEERTQEAIASLRTSVDPEYTAPQELPETESFAGMQVQKLTPGLARRYAHEDQTGVVVTHVEPESPAAEQGIQTGHLIKEIDYTPIENLKDYEAVIQKLKENNEKLALVYVKDSNHSGNYVTLKIDPNDR